MKTLSIYTKQGCSYCAQAKEHLNKLGITYEEVDVVSTPGARERLLAEGHKTLPVLYAGDQLLVPGGYTTLKTMRKDEILERLK